MMEGKKNGCDVDLTQLEGRVKGDGKGMVLRNSARGSVWVSAVTRPGESQSQHRNQYASLFGDADWIW